MKSTITKRWVRGSLLFTILIVLLAGGIFIFTTIDSYYSSARTAVEGQLYLLSGQLRGQVSPRVLRSAVEQYDNKTKFELQMLNAAGRVEMTTLGVLPSAGADVPPDVAQVLQPGGPESMEYIGPNATGEKVLAITMLLPSPSDDIVAMRIVTSLELIDRQLYRIIGVTVMFVCLVILASIVSGVYFIRSIVLPLHKVEETAAKIAQGDFDIRVEHKRDDEVGSLCKTINHMAEELSRTERMKNEFISSVSHELRTPLTSIKGWTETVGRLKQVDDPAFRRGVQIVAGEADRLYEMVEELLDFSRIQEGLRLQCELLDLAAEVEEACMISEQRAVNEGISLEYKIPELPVPVMADKNRLRQVFINVLDNAIKYSKPGHEVRVEILQDSGNAFVKINDSGLGMDEEDLANVKLKFYKGKGALRGSGIGLAVADEIMKKHGGSLLISSAPGEGTEVNLRFNIYKAGQQPEKAKN